MNDRNTKTDIAFLKKWRKFFRKPGERKMYWMGVPIVEYPFDLFNIQELIFNINPKWIIETGTAWGGSSLFYADMMKLMGNGGRVVTIDYNDYRYDSVKARSDILFLNSCSDYETALGIIDSTIKSGPVIVVLDSDNSEEYKYQELCTYSRFVTPNSYMIAKAGGLDYYPEYETGVMPAIERFLKEHKEFQCDMTRTYKHLLTYHPFGYLKRVVQ